LAAEGSGVLEEEEEASAAGARAAVGNKV